MENRSIEILNADGSLDKNVQFCGRESDESTIFVLLYESELGEVTPKLWIESLDPNHAFALSLADAATCKIAEDHELFALVEREIQSPDEYHTTRFLGWVNTQF